MNNQSAEELLQQMHMAIQEGNLDVVQQLKERYNAIVSGDTISSKLEAEELLQQIRNAMMSGDLDTVQQLKEEYDKLNLSNLEESSKKTK